MTATRHGHESRPLDAEPSCAASQWVVLGAGRLGRGFLAPVACELGFRSLLLVAGENTSQAAVEQFNHARDAGEGYWIELDTPSERVQMLDYTFSTVVDTRVPIEAIADHRTQVLSTSIGGDRLGQVAPMIAEGLRLRAQQGDGAEVPRLLILACENGRSATGLTAAEVLRDAIEAIMPRAEISRLAELPRVVIDAMIPALGGPQSVLRVSRGTLWIEECDLAVELVARSSHIRMLSSSDVEALHTRKLYCFNALHLLLAVIGHYAGETTIDRVATDPSLQAPLDSIVNGLVAASCQRHGLHPDDVVGGESTAAYAKRVMTRLQRPQWDHFDPVARVAPKLRGGWYMEDGRIDGPLEDAGLIAEPHRCRQLTHAASLCMYFVVTSIRQLEQRFFWLDAGRTLPQSGLDGSVTNLIRGTAFVPASTFGDENQNSALNEAFARDFLELQRTMKGTWSTERVARFLDREIPTRLRVLPRGLSNLGCVIFDLDEGLVASESLLYRVTQILITEHSHRGRTITHDDYARHVGMSEIDFFAKMHSAYQIRGMTADELVAERDRRYQSALSATEPDSLVKPGFREVLELLERRGVRMAVCSNASKRRVEATLKHVGLANYFGATMTPDEGLQPKPSPDMLLALQERFGLEASRCLVVESSLLGVAASVDAGCYTLLLVNDYTAPLLVGRRGVEVLGNAQVLRSWFAAYFAPQ